jgi:hypothetical protein
MLAVVLVLGCDKSDVGQTFPVRGMVRLQGEPLTAKSTAILFKPDVGRGNHSPFEPAGTVDRAGQYKLTTRGKPGAPPGWYKVIVTAYEAPPEHPKGTRRGGRPVATSLVAAKYGLAETTPLAVEVVAEPKPGAYDLTLSK